MYRPLYAIVVLTVAAGGGCTPAGTQYVLRSEQNRVNAVNSVTTSNIGTTNDWTQVVVSDPDTPLKCGTNTGGLRVYEGDAATHCSQKLKDTFTQVQTGLNNYINDALTAMNSCLAEGSSQRTISDDKKAVNVVHCREYNYQVAWDDDGLVSFQVTDANGMHELNYERGDHLYFTQPLEREGGVAYAVQLLPLPEDLGEKVMPKANKTQLEDLLK